MQKRRQNLLFYRLSDGQAVGVRTNPAPSLSDSRDRKAMAREIVDFVLADLAEKGLGALPIDEPPDDLHNHRVAEGALVRKPQAEIEAGEIADAEITMRMKRDALLRRKVDPIAGNPLRWSGMSRAKQQRIAEYRQALLDLPANTSDPRNPQWPEAPE